MDSFEWNKIAGAVLFALLVSFGLSIFSEMIFHSEAPESPGYVIAVAEQPEGEGAGGEAPAAQPIGVLMAAADPAAGEAAAKKCATCHTFASGEVNKVGPNLWNIVNRPIAAHEGFEYDEAMRAYAEQAKTWTFENLNTFLHDPKKTVPGTKMAFAGLKNDAERGNVIAYLRSLSDSPAPLPEAAAEPATATDAAAAAPAEANEAAAAPSEQAAAPAAEQPPQPAEQQQAAAPAEANEAAAAPSEQAAAPAAEQPAAPAQEQAAAPAQPEAPAAPAAPAEGQGAQQQAAAPAVPTAPAEAGGAAAGGFGVQVAAADPAKGQNLVKRCAACHTFEKDGANKIGPHLWGIVDRPIASVADFAYSDSMKTFSEGGAKTWTYDELSEYLTNPKAEIPGNKMAFPGLKKDADRAAVIAYLRTLADSPAPLPAQ